MSWGIYSIQGWKTQLPTNFDGGNIIYQRGKDCVGGRGDTAIEKLCGASPLYTRDRPGDAITELDSLKTTVMKGS